MRTIRTIRAPRSADPLSESGFRKPLPSKFQHPSSCLSLAPRSSWGLRTCSPPPPNPQSRLVLVGRLCQKNWTLAGGRRATVVRVLTCSGTSSKPSACSSTDSGRRRRAREAMARCGPAGRTASVAPGRHRPPPAWSRPARPAPPRTCPRAAARVRQGVPERGLLVCGAPVALTFHVRSRPALCAALHSPGTELSGCSLPRAGPRQPHQGLPSLDPAFLPACRRCIPVGVSLTTIKESTQSSVYAPIPLQPFTQP